MKAAKKVELLAPAGNAEAFYGAIHAGADAIYLGGSRFGARAYAENFSEEELVACIRYAHLFQRKVYLTVNTLVKESEFSGLYEYVLPYYRAGLDGVIVQDMGVFAYLREHFPGMELHGSTQMTITGEYGAAFLKEQGACRVVPARELSLAEIRRLRKYVTGPILRLSVLYMELFVIAIPDSACSAVFWGAEVATEDVVPSLVACPIPLENIRRNVIL